MEEILKANFLSITSKEDKTIKKKNPDKFGYIKCLNFHIQKYQNAKTWKFFPMTLAKTQVYKHQVLPMVNIHEHLIPTLVRVRPDTLPTS